MIYLLLGIILMIIGFRSYSYFNRNQKTIHYELSKLHHFSIMLILIGIILALISIYNMFI